MRRILSVLILLALAATFAVAVAQEETAEPTPVDITATVTLPVEVTEPAVEPTAAATDETPAATSAPTQTPAPEATDTVEPEATEEMIPADRQAHFRIAHFVADGPAVTIEVNGATMKSVALSFPELSDWETVDAGNYQIVVSTDDADSTVVAQIDADLEVGTWRTIALIGSVETGTITSTEIVEDYGDLNPGTGGLTVFFGIEGDMMVNLNRNTVPYVTELTYPGAVDNGVSQLTIHDDSGIYDFQVVETQDPTVIVADLPQNEIAENAYTFIAVVGTEASPQAIVHVTDRSEVNMELGTLPRPGTLLEAAMSDENLTTLATALQVSGLADELSEGGPYTVFAPANFALDNADLSDPQALADLLRYHIVEGKLLSRGVTSAQTLNTLAGTPITVSIQGNNIFVNDAQIIALNIPATNGVIHMINQVLTPPES